MFMLLIHLLLADGDLKTPPPERVARITFESEWACQTELRRWYLTDNSENVGDAVLELPEADGDPRWVPFYAECVRTASLT